MGKFERLQVSIVVERRLCDHPWQDHEWVTTGVSLDVGADENWICLYQSDQVRRYLSPCALLELHSSETEAYIYNLESPWPSVFVVLGEDADATDTAAPFQVHLVTVSPYEAQDYLDSSEDMVSRLALQPELIAWMERFIGEHHQETEFRKRKRDRLRVEDHKFGQEPVVELRRRGLKKQTGKLH